MTAPFPPCDIYAVTGKPVLHSRSPLLFQPVLEGTPARYLRLAAPTAAEALASARHIGIRGLNVTAPFKEEILRLADHADPAARAIGAANALTLGPNGVTAWNTDHRGVAGALAAAGCDPDGKRAVVLGAGGAGRAAAYGLIRARATVAIVNRTFDKARTLAELFRCRAHPLDELSTTLADADILVTTIPDPMAALSAEHFHAGLTMLDANYTGTTLAQLCRKMGTRYIPGTEWLFHQALPSYELFTGRKADAELMRQGLATPSLDDEQPVALIGFMGSGKTTIGRSLAALTGRAFIDTDEWTEQQSGMTIADLFVEKGEPFFREREKEALAAALDYPQAIISCGGGIVLDEENRRLLREKAIVVWLFTDLTTTLVRAADDPHQRPILQNAPLRNAAKLLIERTPLYAESSDLIIDATAMTAEDIVPLIAEELGRLA